MNEDCIFCKIIEGKIKTEIVFEDELVLAFKDVNPQAPEHVLFIPKKHIETLNDLEIQDKELLGHLFLVISQVARNMGFSEDGYRVVVNCNKNAGQEVFHVHLHLLGGRVFRWPPG